MKTLTPCIALLFALPVSAATESGGALDAFGFADALRSQAGPGWRRMCGARPKVRSAAPRPILQPGRPSARS